MGLFIFLLLISTGFGREDRKETDVLWDRNKKKGSMNVSKKSEV